MEPGGRLPAARSTGNGACTVRVPLSAVADVDEEVTDLLRRADGADRAGAVP